MPGLDPGIHQVAQRTTPLRTAEAGSWIAGSSPAMTAEQVAMTPVASRQIDLA
jgi:hypothetical protein